MSEGYNFIEQLVPAADPATVEHHVTLVSVLVVAVGLLLAGVAARARLRSAPNALIPEKRLTLRTFFELLTQFIVDLGDSTMGKENRRYLPFVATLFIFILSMNMLGLVPGFVMPTHRVAINAGLALLVFFFYNFWGIREVGIVAYLKHLWGPIFFVGFLLFPIEIISHLIRPLSLTLRLFGNMTGDHMVLGVFTDLTRNIYAGGVFIPVPAPVIFYFLGTVVCFIQAFVFTLLTMIYIRLAVAHDEEHH